MSMIKQLKHRDKMLDCISRIVEQWIWGGDFKISHYEFKRSEIVERLHLRDIETLVVADEVMEENNANN